MADPLLATVAAIGSAITAASGAAASATLALTGSATLAAAAGNAVLGLASWKTALYAAGFAATALLTPSVNVEGSPTEWRADPNAGIPFVMGEMASAGVIVHRDAYGKDNHVNSIVTVYSGAGPIQSFDEFYADDVAMAFGANGVATNGGSFADNMWIQTSVGLQPQTTALSQTLDAKGVTPFSFKGWSSASKISGKAHALLTLRDAERRPNYPSGEPATLFRMRGILGYDPRFDSTVPGGSGPCRFGQPSTYVPIVTPAQGGLNWCLGLYENGQLVGGIGASPDGIHMPAFIEWMNVCDANGWKLSAVPTSADDKHQVLQALMQAGGARYAGYQGRISCIVRAPKSSVITLSSRDTAGPFEVDLDADRMVRTNTIRPRCRMESHRWEMVAQPPVSEAAYVTEDGGPRTRPVDYPFVALLSDGSNSAQVAQLAAYAIVDSREAILGTVPLKPWGAQIRPGDVFTITDADLLLDGVALLCLRREIDLESGVVSISFISESAGKHDYALGLDPTPPTPPGLSIPDVYAVDPPEVDAWAVAPGSGDQPSITVTGSADDAPGARAFIVEYRTALDPETGEAWTEAESGWTSFGGEHSPDTRRITLTGLEPNTAYEVAVRYISALGVVGPRRVLGTVTTGDINATRVGNRTADQVNDLIDAQRSEIDAARDAVREGVADLPAALDAFRARFEALAGSGPTANLDAALDAYGASVVQGAQDVLDAAQLGDDLIAARVRRVEAPSENLIPDTWGLTGSSRYWFGADGGPALGVPQGGYRHWRDEHDPAAAGADAGPRLVLGPRQPVNAGELFELSGRVTLEGVATNARLQLAVFATQTSEIPLGGGIISAPVQPGNRDGAFDLEIPQDGWAQFRVVTDAGASGAGAVELAGGLWRKATPGQAAISDDPSRDSADDAFFQEIIAAIGSLAAGEERLRASNQYQLAELRKLVIAQVDGGITLVQDLEELTARVGQFETQVTTLSQAVAGALEEASRIARLEVGTVLNRLPDPLFENWTAYWSVSDGQGDLVRDREGGNYLLTLTRSAPGAGLVGIIQHEPIPVLTGQRIEWSPRLRASGAGGASVGLRVQFQNRDGINVGAPVAGPSISGAGWQSLPMFATATADGFAVVQITLSATGAGDVTADFDEPQLLGALEGQDTRTPFLAANDPRRSEISELQRVSARLAQQIENLRLQSGYGLGEIRQERQVRETEFGQLAQDQLTLRGDLETLDGNTYSIAEAQETFRTATQVDNAIAAFDLSLNSSFTTALGERALASDVYSRSEADLEFMTANEVDLAIGAFNLSFNTSFTEALAERPLATEVYSRADADLLFMTSSEVDTAIGLFDLSFNTSFTDALADRPLATDVYSRSEADLEFMTASEVDAAIGAFDLALNTTFGTAFDAELSQAMAALSIATQSDIDDALSAIDFSTYAQLDDVFTATSLYLSSFTDGAGNRLSLFALEQDVNGSISGIYGLNDGVSSALDFDFDLVTFGGVQIVTGLDGGTLIAPNLRVGEVEAGSIRAESFEVGGLGASAKAPTLAEFQFPIPWTQHGGNRALVENWDTLERQTSPLQIPAGATVTVQATYFLSTWVGLHTLLTFRDRIEIEGAVSQDFGAIVRKATAASTALSQGDYGIEEPTVFEYRRESNFVMPSAAEITGKLTVEPWATRSNNVCCHQLGLGTLNSLPGDLDFHEAILLREVNLSISYLMPGPFQS